jgi:predicted transcriptional regulator YheO
LSSEQVEALKARVDAEESKAALARELNICRETVYQYIRK